MTEPWDGVEDARREAGDRMLGYLRVALTVAARSAEQHQYRRAELARVAATWGGEHERALHRQLRAEASAVKAELRPAIHPEWWEKATAERMAHNWATARAYGAVDPELAGTARWMGEEIWRRHGVDPDALWQRVEEQARRERAEQVAAAALVVGADRDDRAVVIDAAVQRALEPMDGIAMDPVVAAAQEAGLRYSREVPWTEHDPEVAQALMRDAAGQVLTQWDTPGRREQLAARMEARGVPVEARAARLAADVGAASPPAAAVTPLARAGRPPRSREQDGRGRERGRER